MCRHAERDVDDGEGNFRHLVDEEAWNSFNLQFLILEYDFNVYLGLAICGLNPFWKSLHRAQYFIYCDDTL